MPKRKPTAKKAAAPAAKSAPKSGAAAASNFDLAHIREIVGLMADNDLSYFHFEQKESKLEIRRGSDFAAAGGRLLPRSGRYTLGGRPLVDERILSWTLDDPGLTASSFAAGPR